MWINVSSYSVLSLTVPLVKPNDVAVFESSIGATTANITWTAVDTSPERLRGFFRGYRVSQMPQTLQLHVVYTYTTHDTSGAVIYLRQTVDGNV